MEVSESELTRSSHENVTIKGFVFMVIAAIMAMLAIFNYIFTHRVSDGYTISGWIARVPLLVVFSALGAGFLLLVTLIYAQHPIDRAITVCSLMVCFALVMWVLMDKPTEFDGIAPPDISMGGVFTNDYSSHVATLCLASVAWAYFVFLGGSARLDRLKFFSVASACIIGTLYTLSYCSMVVSMTMVDVVQSGDYHGHGLLVYILFGAILFCGAVFTLFSIETAVKSVSGYHSDQFVNMYNAAPKYVHDSVASTHSAGFWCIILAVVIPMVCAWSLRENVLSAPVEKRNSNWRGIGNMFILGALAIPSVTVLLTNHSRDGGFTAWGVNVMESVVVSVITLFSMAMFQDWTPERVSMLVAVLIGLNIGMDFVYRGRTGEALNYTTIFYVANEVSKKIVDDPVEQPLVTAGLVAVLMAGDVYLRDVAGASMSAPMFFVSFAASYGAIQYAYGENKTGIVGEHKGAMELAFSFWIFNVFMNSTFEHLEHIPGYVTHVVLPVLSGVVGAYGYDRVMRDPKVAGKIDEYQNDAMIKEKQIKEDFSHLKPPF